MTKEELAMMDELASDPDYIASINDKFEEMINDPDYNAWLESHVTGTEVA